MAEENKGTFEKVGSSAGGFAGKAADVGVDVMSSMIRTAAGLFGGWWSDRSADEVTRSFGASEDSACRRHFENAARDRSYDNVRPLYQFGHLAGQNPDYQGRSFEEVEGDLEKTWSGDQREKYGEWTAVRDYVGTGYKI
jgi:hypothetical protein